MRKSILSCFLLAAVIAAFDIPRDTGMRIMFLWVVFVIILETWPPGARTIFKRRDRP